MNNLGIYSNVPSFKSVDSEWVAWVDIMGMQEAMQRNEIQAAGNVFKIHNAALNRQNQNVRLYPVMDGFYATTASILELKSFLCGVMSDMIYHNCATQGGPGGWVIIRGGISFGSVIHGEMQDKSACPVVVGRKEYSKSLIIGKPIIYAHQAEGLASPFGFGIHSSSVKDKSGLAVEKCKLSKENAPVRVWRWHTESNVTVHPLFWPKMKIYFEFCEEQYQYLNYSLARIRSHREDVRQYFGF